MKTRVMAATAWVIASAPALADTYTGNFSTAGFAANNTVVAGGVPMAVTANGSLTITRGANSGGYDLTTVRPNFATNEDFTQDVTIDLPLTPSGQFPLQAEETVYFSSFYKVVFYAGAEQGTSFVGAMTGGSALFQGTVLTLRVTRTGQTVSQYFSTDGQSFTLLGQATDAGYAATASFGLQLFAAGTTAQGSATFSDFSVETISAPVPEPGEWAMILAGLMVSTAAARHRRTS